MKILKYMLIFIPISIIGKFMNFPSSVMFILAALSIIPLAGIMGEGTEEISFYTGPKVGGFLNATFDSFIIVSVPDSDCYNIVQYNVVFDIIHDI